MKPKSLRPLFGGTQRNTNQPSEPLPMTNHQPVSLAGQSRRPLRVELRIAFACCLGFRGENTRSSSHQPQLAGSASQDKMTPHGCLVRPKQSGSGHRQFRPPSACRFHVAGFFPFLTFPRCCPGPILRYAWPYESTHFWWTREVGSEGL